MRTLTKAGSVPKLLVKALQKILQLPAVWAFTPTIVATPDPLSPQEGVIKTI
jgi:hypothetical protein